MSSSPPSLPSSFDPALELHTEPNLPEPHLAESDSNSEDLEALHIQEEELRIAKSSAGVVIQHRSWEFLGTLCSSDVFNPETPSKPTTTRRSLPADKKRLALPAPMPLSSSPVLYPQSSSPPAASQKRKLFQSWEPEEPRKRKTLGGFILDEGDEESVTVADPRKKEAATLNAETVSVSPAVTVSIQDLGKVATRSRSPSLPPLPQSDTWNQLTHTVPIRTSSGKLLNVTLRPKSKQLTYEQTIAQRSTTAPGRAKKSYYGIDIHRLMNEHRSRADTDTACQEVDQRDVPYASIERPVGATSHHKPGEYQLWTEKYRARKFTDLIGDERTHRSVLRWLKSWDPIVFPRNTKSIAKRKQPFGVSDPQILDENVQHRKILLLTGPPGLGKTTLAHVCAKQAGYETLEINASDERSRDVVKGRIRDAVGTENVKGIDVVKGDKKTRKAGRPVCVVVDEVDGVVAGASGGGSEGGFMKALLDLIQLDQRNTQPAGDTSYGPKKSKKGDKFRLLRPVILICNDLYVPALRPLRTSSCAEIIHVRNPPVEKAVNRLTSIFEREGISSDGDAIRRLCEASWGTAGRKQGQNNTGGVGEGDIRGVLVQCEWIAHKLRSASNHAKTPRLTKSWIEENILNSDSQPSCGRSRGGTREIVERVFIEGAGLPNLPTKSSAEDAKVYAESNTAPIGVSELRKRAAVASIREMVDTLGDHDRLTTDCFTIYPTESYQDDPYLTKPIAAYDWLHFHDMLSSRVFNGQEWELNPYLSQSVCAFHHLFAAVNNDRQCGWDADHSAAIVKDTEDRSRPFSGPRADFAAYEAEKANRAVITEFQSSFSAPLLRLYRSTDAIAAELIPNVTRMLAPEVKPVIVGGSGGQSSVASVRKESEKTCVKIASRVMSGLNVAFERVRIEVEGGEAHSHAGFALRMEPPLDSLARFESTKTTSSSGPPAPVRYAVRQVLDQEHRREIQRIRSENCSARATGQNRLDAPHTGDDGNKENATDTSVKKNVSAAAGKRDFFGRIINEARPGSAGQGMKSAASKAVQKAEERVWVSFHEGFSNAVRKPITLREFLDSF
ncbi:hypothetical protein GJ744_003108 [Endocarpon pusillum]|uniref:AAA+ ATPase domain-containing protein n=1 Tax=Endocarpon pusillum TaxID=364733 RepID=A0A8H7AMD9_9EURO|nr:hypothetical protein GJ744_003108 [Endocarpon pusillum]